MKKSVISMAGRQATRLIGGRAHGGFFNSVSPPGLFNYTVYNKAFVDKCFISFKMDQQMSSAEFSVPFGFCRPTLVSCFLGFENLCKFQNFWLYMYITCVVDPHWFQYGFESEFDPDTGF
jgi:hypothetical protein